MLPLGTTMASTTTAYSPWMLSHGDALTYLFEVYAFEGSITFKVTIETKNPDDTAPAAPGGGTTSITITSKPSGLKEARVTGLKQLFRYKFEVTGGSGDEKFIHFRMLDAILEVDHV